MLQEDSRRFAVVPVAVDQRKAGCGLQAVDGHLHGLNAGAEDIGGVNLLGLYPGHRPGHRHGSNRVVQGIPPLGRHLLGVVESLNGALGGQNDRPGVDRDADGLPVG